MEGTQRCAKTGDSNEKWLQHFPDLYGYQACSDGLTKWIDDAAGTWCVSETAESEHVLFYPPMPGNVQFRNVWYMKKRMKPM
eukprot:12418318-Karenia_brevis.AAC.1